MKSFLNKDMSLIKTFLKKLMSKAGLDLMQKGTKFQSLGAQTLKDLYLYALRLNEGCKLRNGE